MSCIVGSILNPSKLRSLGMRLSCHYTLHGQLFCSVTFFLGSDWRWAGALLCSFRDTSFSSRDGGEVGGGEVEGGEVRR